MDLTTCPECGSPAEIEWRAVLDSTDGPVEHAKLGCMNGHWFLLPVASLARPTRPAEPPHRRPAVGHDRSAGGGGGCSRR